MDQFSLHIVTPDRDYLTSKAESVVLNAEEVGQMTVLAHHLDLLATIDITPLKIVSEGKATYFALGGGTLFFDHDKNALTLVVNSIEARDEIDLARAKEAKVKAEKLLGVKEDRSRIAQLEIERKLKRALNRIHVKEAYR